MKKLVDIIGKEEFEKLSEETQQKWSDKEFIENDGTYIPKAKFDSLNETKKSLENQLKETNEKVQELSKVDSSELQNKLNELQEKYDNDIKTANEKYEAREYEYRLKDFIKNEKFSSKSSQTAYYDVWRLRLDVYGFELASCGIFSNCSANGRCGCSFAEYAFISRG